METASSLQIRGFSAGKEESLESEQLESPASLGTLALLSCTVTNLISVVDDQFDFNEVENEKFQNIKTSNKKTTSLPRKSDGRKSSAPRKVPVCEGEEERSPDLDRSRSRYSILGSYLNSCRRTGQTNQPDPPSPSHYSESGTDMKGEYEYYSLSRQRSHLESHGDLKGLSYIHIVVSSHS